MSENASSQPPAAPPAKGGSSLFQMINAALLVGVLAVVVMMFLNQKKGPAAPAATAPAAEGAKAEGGEGAKEGAPAAAAKASPGAGPTVRFADFVIHLRNPEADRYARMSFEIEVATDKDKDIITAHNAQIRDAFISYLSDRTVEELRGSNGLSLIKAALMKQVSDLAPDGHARSLYITDFVIQ